MREIREESLEKSSYLTDEDFQIGIFVHGDTSAHTHDFMELVYVLGGRAVHTANDKSCEIQTGDYFMIDYKMWHQYECPPGEQLTLINLLFRPSFIDKTLSRCESFQQLLSHYLIRFQDTALQQLPTGTVFHDSGTILELFQRMRQEYASKNYGYIELLRSYLIEVIVLSLRSITDGTHTAPRHPCTAFMADYISQRYMEPVTLTQLSGLLSYSLPYLSKRFKEDTGVTFQDYLQRTRISHSCRLLANTNQTVSEIAERVGYTDIKFFQEVFKRIMHTTPKAYRKEYHLGRPPEKG